MLRLTEIKLALDHLEVEIKRAILKKLQIAPEQLTSYTIFKRSYDARKRGEITLHTKHTISGYETETVFLILVFLKLADKISGISVFVDFLVGGLRFAEPLSINDTGMVQSVGVYNVFV